LKAPKTSDADRKVVTGSQKSSCNAHNYEYGYIIKLEYVNLTLRSVQSNWKKKKKSHVLKRPCSTIPFT